MIFVIILDILIIYNTFATVSSIWFLSSFFNFRVFKYLQILTFIGYTVAFFMYYTLTPLMLQVYSLILDNIINLVLKFTRFKTNSLYRQVVPRCSTCHSSRMICGLLSTCHSHFFLPPARMNFVHYF